MRKICDTAEIEGEDFIMFIKAVNAIVRPLFLLLYAYKFKNAHNIPESGAYIVCANHLHAFDPLFIEMAVRPRHVSFLAKAELFKNTLLAKLFTAYKMIPIDRDKPELSSIKSVLSEIKKGNIVGIFPEGTRSKTGEMLEPKDGAAMFAVKTGVPILPARIEWIKRKFYFPKVVVTFGEPFKCKELGFDLSEKDALSSVSREIMKRIKDA